MDGVEGNLQGVGDGHPDVTGEVARPVDANAILVGRADGLATLESAAADGDGPAGGPVVAAGVLVDAMCPNHCRTDMGGPNAPRSAEQGADTIVWLATRPDDSPTGLLWEDREVVPW